jgi:hypothetical protein
MLNLRKIILEKQNRKRNCLKSFKYVFLNKIQYFYQLEQKLYLLAEN